MKNSKMNFLAAAAIACLLSASEAFTSFHPGPLSQEYSTTTGDIHPRRPSKLYAAAATKSSQNLAIAGRLFPALSKFMIGPPKARKIAAKVGESVQINDLYLIAIFGWALVPLCKQIFRLTHDDGQMHKFQGSLLYKIPNIVSQVVRIGGIIYATDILALALNVLGIRYPYQHHIGARAGKILGSLWTSWKLSQLKRHFIFKRLQKRQKMGKAQMYNRAANGALVVLTFFVLLDFLNIPTGRALSSVFALGGLGALVFSLASKELAEQFVSGLSLSATDKFNEGEEIVVRGTAEGIVNKMDWLHTEIRGFDEVITSIPNSQLARERISNKSRLRKSQVEVKLWFAHEDVDRIPALLKDIKTEIQDACPRLISDGTRPFRAHLRDFTDSNLEAVIDARFNIPPASGNYWDNRQTVLEAIAAAAKKNNIEFDIPKLAIRTPSSTRLPKSFMAIVSTAGIEDDFESTESTLEQKD